MAALDFPMRLIEPSLREPLDTPFLKYVRLSPGGRGLARCLALTAVPAPRCSAHVESLWTGSPAKQSHSVAYPSQRFADATGRPREVSLGSLRGRMLGTPPLCRSPPPQTAARMAVRLLACVKTAFLVIHSGATSYRRTPVQM